MQVIVPYLTVSDAAKAIDFYIKAFGARENSRAPADDGKRIMHADLSFNGGSVFLMDLFPEYCRHGEQLPTPERVSPANVVINYATPAELDAAFRRAVEAGCSSVTEPHDAFWNARFAVVGDPYGYHWLLNAPLPAKAA